LKALVDCGASSMWSKINVKLLALMEGCRSRSSIEATDGTKKRKQKEVIL
jgi:hypothetical protein